MPAIVISLHTKTYRRAKAHDRAAYVRRRRSRVRYVLLSLGAPAQTNVDTNSEASRRKKKKKGPDIYPLLRWAAQEASKNATQLNLRTHGGATRNCSHMNAPSLQKHTAFFFFFCEDKASVVQSEEKGRACAHCVYPRPRCRPLSRS